jgi:hypothetical protein
MAMIVWGVIVLLAGGGGLVFAVLTVVTLVKQQPWPALRNGLLTVGLALLTLHALMTFAERATNVVMTSILGEPTAIQRVSPQQTPAARLRAMTPRAQLAKAPPEFFSDEGFRDWWRIPLIYPYSLLAIDSLDGSATLMRHKGGPIGDPNRSEEGLQISVMRYAFDGHWLLFERNGGKEWGLMNFASGKRQSFPSEAALLAAAKAKGYSGSTTLQTIQEGYDGYFSAK